MNQSNETQKLPCNCTRIVCPCPRAEIARNRRTRDVVYKATIKHRIELNTYTGSTEQEFKNRVAFHRSCMRHAHLSTFCELSNKEHELSGQGIDYNVTCKIVEVAKSFKPGDTYCKLCSSEIYHILYNSGIESLNDVRLLPCLHKRKAMKPF